MRKGKNVFNQLHLLTSYFSLPCSGPGALSPLPGQHRSSDPAVPWMQQVNKRDSSTVPGSGQTSTHCWAAAVMLEPKSLAPSSTFNLWHITLQRDLHHFHVGHPFPPPTLPGMGTSCCGLLVGQVCSSTMEFIRSFWDAKRPSQACPHGVGRICGKKDSRSCCNDRLQPRRALTPHSHSQNRQ